VFSWGLTWYRRQRAVQFMGTRRTHQEDLRRPACGAASPPKLGAAGIKVDRRMLGESGRRPRHLRSGTIAGLPVHRGPYARRAQWMLPESCHPRPTGCGRTRAYPNDC